MMNFGFCLNHKLSRRHCDFADFISLRASFRMESMGELQL